MTDRKRKETTMTDRKRPEWIKNAPRVDRPDIIHGRALQQFEIFAEAQETLSEPTKGAGKQGPSDAGPAPSETVPF